MDQSENESIGKLADLVVGVVEPGLCSEVLGKVLVPIHNETVTAEIRMNCKKSKKTNICGK